MQGRKSGESLKNMSILLWKIFKRLGEGERLASGGCRIKEMDTFMLQELDVKGLKRVE